MTDADRTARRAELRARMAERRARADAELIIRAARLAEVAGELNTAAVRRANLRAGQLRMF